MKVLIGQFVTESNANIPHQCEITDYDIAFGEECHPEDADPSGF